MHEAMFHKSHLSFILIQCLVVKIDIDVCGDVLARWLNHWVSPSKCQVKTIVQTILSTDILTHLQYKTNVIYNSILGNIYIPAVAYTVGNRINIHNK